MSSLEPCPFCGSSNIDDSCGDKETSGRPFYFVFCNRCEASGPSSYEQERAIVMWNKRTKEEL